MRVYIILVALFIGGSYAYNKYLGTINPLEGMLNVAQKHPDPEWSPRLEYWVAMVYYQKSDYGKSQEVFNRLLTDYPTTYYAPKALIRLSLSAQENRDWETAKDALARYVERFPEGKDSSMAKATLDKLKFEHP
ncbi:MAG: tetratricopeptide repeat protein [Elusimicrobia bacterium]|nr:tetratricopeptide repeat protein [Elusimicrobiota bacterium]